MNRLQIVLIIGALAYLIIIFVLLKKQRLNVRYSLLWLAGALAMLLFACFPYLVKVLRDYTGVEVVSNLVFLLVIVFMMFLLLSLSAAVSGQAEKIKRLTQAAALLEKRLRSLENGTAGAEKAPPATGEGSAAPFGRETAEDTGAGAAQGLFAGRTEGTGTGAAKPPAQGAGPSPAPGKNA